MPVAIPQSSGEYRYRGVAEGRQPATAISAGDALRAFAEDLLANGDVQVALERAFRWGYRNDQGEHVTGLQEHLLHLRQQRERILRQVQNEHFLEALSPELDRLDALDREPGQHLGEVDDESQHPLDRLIARLTHGYRSPEAQAGLEELLHDMRDAADPEGSARARSDTHTGESQPASVFGDMRSTANASADTLRRMLFSGGLDAGSRSAGTWRRETGESPVRSSLHDLALLTELEAVEEAIAQFEAIGGVTELVEIDLDFIGDDDLVDWLRQWQLAIASVAPAGSAAVTGSIPLPPDVISAIGRDLLKGLFRAERSQVTGEHQSMSRGNAGDPSETSVSWEPGRPLDLDLVATVSSAVRRGAGAGKGRVRLEPDDFVVVERASAISMSTVLAIDRSRSMGQSGAWIAAKKVGMAMHELIRQSYPRDSLGIVTFSSTATKVDIRDIPQLEWDRYEHGTHLQAALALGRRMLRNRSSGTRQIVVVTDGEPTLATVHGVEVFASPPTDEVLEATMSEVVRCTRENITINIVMLGEGPGSRFAEQVARVNRGRVFVASSHSLGTFILRDYITR